MSSHFILYTTYQTYVCQNLVMKLNIRYGNYSFTRLRNDFGWSIQDGGPRTAVPWLKLGFFIRGTIYNSIKNVNDHINYNRRSLIKLIITGLQCKNNKLRWFSEQRLTLEHKPELILKHSTS